MENNFKSFLEKAKHINDIESLEGYERFFDPSFFNDEVAGDLDVVLFVIDFRVPSFIYLSPNTNQVHGYSKSEILAVGPIEFYNWLHPTDNKIVLTQIFSDINDFINSNKKIDFTNVKISYNYRLKQKDGSYKFLMNRFSTIIKGPGNAPLVIIGTVRDISDLYTKSELFCRIEEVSTKKRVFEKFYPITESLQSLGITNKEFEILKLVHAGNSSKEIAEILNKSIQTIHTHRKNILKKLDLKSMTDVVVLAKDKGWV